MSKKYTTIDTVVIPNAGRTDSVRISQTVNENDEQATQWTFTNSRFTSFSNDADTCRMINELVSDLMEDEAMMEDMDAFTNKHNN